MKLRCALLLSCLLLGGLHAADDDAATLRAARAGAFITALAKEDFAGARTDFAEVMTKAVSEEFLSKSWKTTLGQFGNFKKQGKLRTERKAPFDIVIITCEFDKTEVDMRIVFDDKQRISGWQIRPAASEVPYTPPAYVRPDRFVERPLTVGAEGWALPGTLTIPKGAGPFPVVVLVHGSGPGDRDETIGPNKPFRDLAWGLASQGIVVLRYEKRTREHARRAAAETNLTIKEETVDDALAAVEALRTVKEVDAAHIFVLGHSLGAFVAPQIGARDAKLAGLILLAGNSRSLEDLILDQFSYIHGLSGEPTEETRSSLKKLAEQVARVKDPELKPDASAQELPLGIPAPYWIALRSYNPTATAVKVSMPLFLLQGERDYQVTMVDFAGWKKALAERKDVRFKSYPDLNHLFMEGKGKATPNEYTHTGHVATEVIDDLAAWIKGR